MVYEFHETGKEHDQKDSGHLSAEIQMLNLLVRKISRKILSHSLKNLQLL